MRRCGWSPLSLLLVGTAVLACPAARNAVVEDSGTARDGDAVPEADAERDATSDVELDPADTDLEPESGPELWRRQVIYLVMPDRFCNGDESNDDLGPEGCHTPDHPRRFHGGDLAGLRRRLGYLEELGVTAVWITPVYRQVGSVGGSCGYHGYWPDFAEPDDGVVEPRFGSAAELEGLVADLNARGSRLILDIVVNHAGYGAAVTRSHPDWFHAADGCEDLGPVDVYCPLSGLPDFAQEDPAAAAYLTESSLGWLRRFGIAGVRMDTAKHVPLEFFAERWIPAVREARPEVFLIAEVFSGDSVSQYLPFLEAGFDATFNFAMHGALLDTFARGGSVDRVADLVSETISTLGLDRALLMVSFLDNHDLPRFMTEAGEGPVDELRRRYHLALTALLTLPGIPQLFAGDELGALGRFPDNRRDMPDWAWDASQRAGTPAGYLPEPAAHFDLTARLIALRRQHPALHQGSYSELWRQRGTGNPNLFAFFRGAGDDRVVVVFNNSRAPSGPVSMPFRDNPGITASDRAAWPDGVVLHDVLGRGAPATATITDGRLTFDMPPLTAGIYLAR